MDNSTVESLIDTLTIPVEVFTPNLAIRILRIAPRMGQSNEFALLVSKDPSEKFEYTSGLVFLGSFFAVFFFMWSFILLVLKWFGPENVGFWSGHAMEPIQETHKTFFSRFKIKLVRAIFGVSAFLWIAFCILFLVNGMNSLEQAQSAFHTSSVGLNRVLDSVTLALTELQFQRDEAVVLRDSVVDDLTTFCSSTDNRRSLEMRRVAETVHQLDVNETTAAAFDSLFASLADESAESDNKTAAPTLPNSPSGAEPADDDAANTEVPVLNFNFSQESMSMAPSSEISTSSGLNETFDIFDFGDSDGLFANTSEAFAHAIDFNDFEGGEAFRGKILDALFFLMLLDDFIAVELEEGQRGINAAMTIAKMLNDTATKANPPNTAAIVFSIPWILVSLTLLIAVVLAWIKRPLKSMLPHISKYVLPLLCLFTMTSTILAVLSVTYAIANADFCSGGTENTPEETLLKMMVTLGFAQEDFAFKTTNFYVSQCQVEYPFEVLDGFRADLDTASASLSEIQSTIGTKSMESIVAKCGTDAEGIDTLLLTMDFHLMAVYNALLAAQSNITCDEVVPTFTFAAHETACDASMNGLYYCYVAFIMMAFTGMIMLTLRTAYLPVDGEEEELIEWKARRKERRTQARAAAKENRQKLRDVEAGTVDDSDVDYSESESYDDSEDYSKEKKVSKSVADPNISQKNRPENSKKASYADEDSDEDDSSDDDSDSHNSRKKKAFVSNKAAVPQQKKALISNTVIGSQQKALTSSKAVGSQQKKASNKIAVPQQKIALISNTEIGSQQKEALTSSKAVGSQQKKALVSNKSVAPATKKVSISSKGKASASDEDVESVEDDSSEDDSDSDESVDSQEKKAFISNKAVVPQQTKALMSNKAVGSQQKKALSSSKAVGSQQKRFLVSNESVAPATKKVSTSSKGNASASDEDVESVEDDSSEDDSDSDESVNSQEKKAFTSNKAVVPQQTKALMSNKAVGSQQKKALSSSKAVGSQQKKGLVSNESVSPATKKVSTSSIGKASEDTSTEEPNLDSYAAVKNVVTVAARKCADSDEEKMVTSTARKGVAPGKGKLSKSRNDSASDAKDEKKMATTLPDTKTEPVQDVDADFKSKPVHEFSDADTKTEPVHLADADIKMEPVREVSDADTKTGSVRDLANDDGVGDVLVADNDDREVVEVNNTKTEPSQEVDTDIKSEPFDEFSDADTKTEPVEDVADTDIKIEPVREVADADTKMGSVRDVANNDGFGDVLVDYEDGGVVEVDAMDDDGCVGDVLVADSNGDGVIEVDAMDDETDDGVGDVLVADSIDDGVIEVEVDAMDDDDDDDDDDDHVG